jgi:hypothetical protein
MSPNNDRKMNALKSWRGLLEDDPYRLDQPEQFYNSLTQRADELVSQKVLSVDEWQVLKGLADDVYSKTIATLQDGDRDLLDTRVLFLQNFSGGV